MFAAGNTSLVLRFSASQEHFCRSRFETESGRDDIVLKPDIQPDWGVNGRPLARQLSFITYG